MTYFSTAEVMDAIAGQVRDQLSQYTDDVVIFDGSLEQAVEDHFGQATKSRLKTVVFLGLTDDLQDAISGAGIPIRNALMVDLVAVVRTDGKSRYTKDRERLYGLSDALVYTVFDCPNWTAGYTARVHANKFVLRRRAASDGDLMAHLVRFTFHPARP